jgi:hypothetical protein
VPSTFQTTSDNPPQFTGQWKNYKIHSFTGYVCGRETQNITTVTSSIHTVAGNPSLGIPSRVEGGVSSTNTRIDAFRLVNPKTQREENIEMVNWGFKIWEDQLVSVAWAIREGQERGPYFIAVNHTTQEQYVMKSAVLDIAKNRSWFRILFLIASFVLFPSLAFVIVFFIIWRVFIGIKVSAFMKSGCEPLVQFLNRKAEVLSEEANK